LLEHDLRWRDFVRGSAADRARQNIKAVTARSRVASRGAHRLRVHCHGAI